MISYWKLACLNIKEDSHSLLTVPLLVCLKLNWMGKGMVQYKLFLGSLKVSSIYALLGTSCLCLFWCQDFLLNCLLASELFTYIPYTVYIFNHSFPSNATYNSTYTWHPTEKGPFLFTSCLVSMFNKYLLSPYCGQKHYTR